ncbi:TPA: DUF2554 family protein [Enterobacter hormaechei]
MFRKGFSLLMLIGALFSGQVMAEHKGHKFLYMKNADHQLRHEADSDELRSEAEESAEELREHHTWQKSRKPDTHFPG